MIVYVSSAWWSWYYGGSFGQRVAVDFMCVFTVFIAYVLSKLEMWKVQGNAKRCYKFVSGAIFVYCGICIAWNLLSMMAYWYRILPSDKATWETVRDIVGMVL